MQYQFKIIIMAKKAITFQLDQSTIDKIKALAESKGWAIQVAAEKSILKGLSKI